MSRVIVNNPKNNFTATIPPTRFDGDYNGYARGSLWINIITGDCFICTNAILNNAEQKTINTADISSILLQLTELTNSASLYDTRINQLEEDSTTTDLKFGELDLYDISLNNRLLGVENDSTILDNRLDVVESDITSLVETLELDESSISSNILRIEELENYDVTNTSNINFINSEIFDLWQNIDLDQTDINEITNRIINLENYDITNSEKILSLDGDILSIQDQFSSDATNNKLMNLLDVDVTSDIPIDEQVLKFDSTSGKWLPKDAIKSLFTNFIVTNELKESVGTVKQFPPQTVYLSKVQATVSVAPQGSNITLNIKKNGISVLGVETLYITPGNFVGNVVQLPLIELLPTDYITVDIVQIGVLISGSDLSVRLTYNFY